MYFQVNDSYPNNTERKLCTTELWRNNLYDTSTWYRYGLTLKCTLLVHGLEQQYQCTPISILITSNALSRCNQFILPPKTTTLLWLLPFWHPSARQLFLWPLQPCVTPISLTGEHICTDRCSVSDRRTVRGEQMEASSQRSGVGCRPQHAALRKVSGEDELVAAPAHLRGDPETSAAASDEGWHARGCSSFRWTNGTSSRDPCVRLNYAGCSSKTKTLFFFFSPGISITH